MRRLANTLSWSLSRRQMFDECRRQYYLNYYRAWGGWEDGADPAARLAYRLKQIVNLDMWVGDVLHRLIEQQIRRLQRGFRPAADPLREQARSLLNQEWRQSVEQRWRESPKHNRNLFEHYYGMAISDERRGEIREKLFACLDHFCSQPLLTRLAAVEPAAWLAVEQLDTFFVDRVPVYVKLDCAARLDDQTLVIDWKSGRPSERDQAQSACYGLYAMQKWNVGFDRLRACLVYLLTNETSDQPIAPEQALAMQEQIVSGIHAMRAALADPVANVAREEDFPMTDQTHRCRRCNFHEICYGPGPIAKE
jgi:hypothetical protein